MANPEHVAIVKKGADAISNWQFHHQNEILDLVGADLTRVDLTEADLTRANFSAASLTNSDLSMVSLMMADLQGANLTGANLRGAILGSAKLGGAILQRADLRDTTLSGADLYNATLIEAKLSRANLRQARLKAANLTGAWLSNSDLSEANLHGAILRGSGLSGAMFWATDVSNADFTDCRCDATIFAELDLSNARGLEDVRHLDASTVGIETIYRSRGRIPEIFLRGCGVPESHIAMIPALIGAMEPIHFYSCFISYSSRDDAFAKCLHSRLEQEKLRVWFAAEDMKGGLKSHEQIEDAIRRHDKLLLVLSPASMESEWVKTEIRHARQREHHEKKQVLFPISLVPFREIKAWKAFDSEIGKDMAVEIREYHIPDFSNWKDHDSFEAGFNRLLSDLRAEGAKS